MIDNKKKKNTIKYFYQILSDIKNNIDTLVKELYDNRNDLDGHAEKGKSVVKKSKYPDLKKLNILKKTDKWEITDLGLELLDIYQKGNKDEYNKIIASILGTYSYNGFRPYAVLCKFLYLKFGIGKSLNREEIVDFLSLPINEAMYFISNNKEPELKDLFYKGKKMIEAPRPYSYWLNYLINAGLVKDGKNGFELTPDIKEFINIFFSDDERAPIYKKDTIRSKYRIMSRGSDQITFRNELLNAYEQKCALTGKVFIMGSNNLLEAAHIIPVSHGGSYEINNGILMTPDLHKAFDAGAFTFDENYNLIVFPNVKEINYLPENKRINYLPKNKDSFPSKISLNYHKEYIFGVGVINSRS